jgi:RNA-directed DNA polymerase
VAISTRKVNWILDADVQNFFARVSQEKLVLFLEHRVGDKRIIRLIQKWRVLQRYGRSSLWTEAVS